jgi:lipid-A-disaccharide synthase-like uncharacterized protein
VRGLKRSAAAVLAARFFINYQSLNSTNKPESMKTFFNCSIYLAVFLLLLEFVQAQNPENDDILLSYYP